MQRRNLLPEAFCGEESAALAFDWDLDGLARISADCVVAGL